MSLNPQVWWFLARSTGVVAWVLLTAAVVWGLLLSTRLLQSRRHPAWLLALHRWLGAVSLFATAGHIAALIADSYVEFGVADVLVPFASEWRPTAVAWGVVTMYLLLLVELSSLLMKRLPKTLWRRIHMLSFLSFWMASMHAAAAGTDATSTWYRVSAIVLVSAVIFTSAYRVLAGTIRGQRRATAAKR